MIKTELLLKQLLNASSTVDIEGLLTKLSVVDHEQYHVDYGNKIIGSWHEDQLHWLPVGGERGNGGRIKLVGRSEEGRRLQLPSGLPTS